MWCSLSKIWSNMISEWVKGQGWSFHIEDEILPSSSIYGNIWRPLRWQQTGYLFRAGYSKRVSHHCLHLAETQRLSEQHKSFIVVKGEGFSMPWLEVVWQGEVGFGLIRSKASYMIELENTFGFLWIGSELEVRTNNRKACEHCTHSDCSGPNAAEGSLAPCTGCYRDCRSEFYFYMCSGQCPFVYSKSHCSFSLLHWKGIP